MGRLPFHKLTLTDGSSITILQRGEHNELFNGPDFQNARIANGGIQWAGPLEIHLKSSDWYKHFHHLDKNYDNVILHVVLEHDKEIVQSGRVLPTIELKNVIDWEHVYRYNRLQLTKGNQPICATSILDIDQSYVKNMVDRAIFKRLNRKALQFNEGEAEEDFLFFIAQAFGSNCNKEAFVLLLRMVKRKRELIDKDEFVSYVESVVSDEQNERIFAWKKRGFRPISKIEKRILQFSLLLYAWKKDKLNAIVNGNPLLAIDDWFKEAEIKDDFLKQQIIINAIVPFIHKQEQAEKLGHRAFELLEALKSEDNAVMRIWKQLGITPKNALESQGLLEIYQQFCTHKLCLNCTIGMKILNR